jgi:hypothetical protein
MFACVTDGFDKGLFNEHVEVIDTPPEALALADLKNPEGERFPSSYRRIWTFSKDARCLGDRVLVLDVDCVITRSLEPLFDFSPADFVGWRPSSAWGKRGRLGGGTWLHRTGTLTHLWEQFIRDPNASIEDAKQAGWNGSDQALLSHWLADRVPVWPEGHGIMQSQDYKTKNKRDEWPLPESARICHFNGRRKPWDCEWSWVKEHWR